HTFFSLFYTYDDHPHLHSFPTRRSSDLLRYLPGLSLTAAKVDDRLFLFFFAQLCRGLVYPSGAKKRSIFDALVEPLAKRIASRQDRKSTRLNSSHVKISYAVFCLKKKNT